MTSPDGLLGQVHTAVIRLDAKMDNVQQEMRHLRDEHKDGHTDHEARLRKIESTYVPMDRVLVLENRPYVSPATVWKVVTAVIALAGVVVAVINTVK